MKRYLLDLLFDHPAPVLLDHVHAVAPDPDLAARNAARIEAAKRQMGDKYLLYRAANEDEMQTHAAHSHNEE